MNVRVDVAAPGSRPCIEALMQLYVYDFSEIMPLDVDEDGHFSPPSLDAYWSEPGHGAFLIRADDQLAGFALLEPRSRITDAPVNDMAQFFVMRRYRKSGVGQAAATTLFDRFLGPWEVRQAPVNLAATAFWRRVIERYTSGKFEESVVTDGTWRGTVQRFVSG
jgi:predicted acetyltransferase